MNDFADKCKIILILTWEEHVSNLSLSFHITSGEFLAVYRVAKCRHWPGSSSADKKKHMGWVMGIVWGRAMHGNFSLYKLGSKTKCQKFSLSVKWTASPPVPNCNFTKESNFRECPLKPKCLYLQTGPSSDSSSTLYRSSNSYLYMCIFTH